MISVTATTNNCEHNTPPLAISRTITPQWAGPKLGWHKDDVNPHLAKYTDLLLGNECNSTNDGAARVFVPLCGKSVDLAHLASHPKTSHVVGIDIVRDAAERFASDLDFPLEELEHNNECREAKEEEEGEGTRAENEKSRSSPPSTAMSVFRGEGLSFVVGDLFDFLSASGGDRSKWMSAGIIPSETTTTAPPALTKYLFDAIYDRASMVAITPSLRKEYVALMGELLQPGGAVLLVSLDRRNTTSDAAKKDGPPFSIDEAEIRQLYEGRPWVESVTLLEEVNDLETDKDRERWEKKGVLELYEMVFLIRKRK